MIMSSRPSGIGSQALDKNCSSWKANFVSVTMFSKEGKQGNNSRKHSVSGTMFPSLSRAKRCCTVHLVALAVNNVVQHVKVEKDF